MSLEKAVRRAEEIASLGPENAESLPMLGHQKYLESPTFIESTASMAPRQRARLAVDSIKPISEKTLQGAGYLEDTSGFEAIGNSKGLFGYHKSTSSNFSVTVRTPDGTGSS